MHLRDGQRVTLFSGNERELSYADQWLEAAVGVVPDALHLSAYPKPPASSEGELNLVATGIRIAFSPSGIWWPGVIIAVVVSFGGVAAPEPPGARRCKHSLLRTSIAFQVIGAISFAVLIATLLTSRLAGDPADQFHHALGQFAGDHGVRARGVAGAPVPSPSPMSIIPMP